jgi:hypothetical protein
MGIRVGEDVDAVVVVSTLFLGHRKLEFHSLETKGNETTCC